MQTIKGLKDEVIVKCEQIFNTKVEIGEKGELLTDPGFDPARSIRMWAEVVQVPTIMSPDRVILALGDNNIQRPSSSDFALDMTFVNYSDLPTPAEIGDKAWFHWNALLGKENHLSEDFYKIRYELLICVHKYYEVMPNGQIWKINPFSDTKLFQIFDDSIFSDDDHYFEKDGRTFCRRTVMCNSYALCQPDTESWEDILHPVPELDASGRPLLDHLNQVVMKPKSQWLQMKSEPQEKASLAFVEHIGEAIKGQTDLGLKKGDHILYYHKANWKVHIDNTLYFVVRQKFIYGLVNSQLATSQPY